jgi:hypothetical protein
MPGSSCIAIAPSITGTDSFAGRIGVRQNKRTFLTIPGIAGPRNVSTQLVMNGVHQFVKDQIMGHAKPTNDMSRHYTNVPRPQLLEAINTLPIIERWANAPWNQNGTTT